MSKWVRICESIWLTTGSSWIGMRTFFFLLWAKMGWVYLTYWLREFSRVSLT